MWGYVRYKLEKPINNLFSLHKVIFLNKDVVKANILESLLKSVGNFRLTT